MQAWSRAVSEIDTPKTIVARWVALSGPVKFWATAATAIAATLTVMTTAPLVWRAMGLPVLATEYHVSTVTAPIRTGLDDVRQEVKSGSMRLAQLQLSGVDAEIFKWKAELEKTPSGPLTVMINTRLSELEIERHAIERSIEAMARVGRAQ